MNQQESRTASAKPCRLREFTSNESLPGHASSMMSSTSAAGDGMKGHFTLRTIQRVFVLGLLLASLAPAQAQVLATQRAGFGLPANQVAAPNTPGGGVVVGSYFYATDQVAGFRHYQPADPANPDPVNAGILQYDNAFADGMSIGGNAPCIPFCKTGQVAYDGNQTVFVTAFDQQKGQPGSVTFPGVHLLTIDPVTGVLQWGGPIAPNAGLGGNQPTAIALGPDGNLYVGFLRNGNVWRIVNPFPNPFVPSTPIVQSVGTSPNGRPIRSLAFIGPDLYLATSDSLAVIKNAIAKTCLGGCNGVAISDGFSGAAHVGLTTDGINRLYISINGAGVYRYTVNTQAMTPISNSGTDPNGAVLSFAFVAGHTNMLFLDRLGNLWIGDDTGDGRLNFSGRIWYISAGQLASIP